MSYPQFSRLAAPVLALLLFWAPGAWAETRAEVEASVAAETAQLAQVVAASGENSEAAATLMFGIGINLSNLGRHIEARDMYLRAARSTEARVGKDSPVLGAMLNNLAGVYDDLEQYEEARTNYVRAVELFMKGLGSKNQFTLRAINSLGGVFVKLYEFDRAQKAYEFALPRRVELHGADSKEALRTKSGLARLLMLRGQYAQANKLLGEIVQAYQRTRAADDEETLKAQLDMAGSFGEMGDYDSAYSLTQRVVQVRMTQYGADDPRTLTALSRQASMLSLMGRFTESLAQFEDVLARRRRVLGEDDDLTLVSWSDLAFAYKSLGRLIEASKIDAMVVARQEKQSGPDDLLTLIARLNQSYTLGQLGQYAQAGQLQVDIATKLANKLGLEHPFTLNAVDSLANTLGTLGEWKQAVEYGKIVVDNRTKVLGAQHRDTLAALHNQGNRYLQLHELDKARTLLEDAVEVIERAAPVHAAMADLPYYYSTLGELYAERGEQDKARELYRRSLALVEQTMGPDHPLAGNVCNYLARSVASPVERIALYGRALRIGRASAAPSVVWRAADGLRAAHEELGNPAVAILYGKQAINAIQGLRQNLTSVSQGTQKSFLADKRHVYSRTADLLIAQGRLPEGQQVMAMLKQEEYFDFVNRGDKDDPAQTKLSLNGQEAGWLERYNSVSDRLVEISKAKAALDAKLRTGSISDDERARRVQYEGDLQAARTAFDAATRQIVEDARRQAQANAGPQRLGSEVIDSVRAMRGDLRQLGHGAVLVHYLVAEDKLWILLTTPEVQVARVSRVKAAELNRRIDVLRSALRDPRSDVLPASQELHRLLLAPIAKDLAQAQARTLMLSLDGALRYVPFGALHDGTGFAVERYRFAMLTEAAKTKIKDAPQAEWTMTGLGLTKAVPGFAALPSVREELTGIVRSGAGGGAGVMGGEALFDEAFTVERVKAVLGDPNPVLHIASHFKFTPGTEADSYLVMGDGGHLSLQQIRQDDLQFNVDLLTLSACETAVGDNARGQEVEGLGALAQKQGAKAVLATLWPVADASTGIFMREMYRRRADDKLTKAEAIRQVQMAFLSGQIKGASGAERSASRQGAAPAPLATGYTHPFYWAPFILMGNWL